MIANLLYCRIQYNTIHKKKRTSIESDLPRELLLGVGLIYCWCVNKSKIENQKPELKIEN